MSPLNTLTGGGTPPEATLRLLRLLSRRGAAIVAPEEADADGRLVVSAACGQIGLVEAAVWWQAHAAGLVQVSGDARGRLAPMGQTVLRRAATSSGAPVEVDDQVRVRRPRDAAAAEPGDGPEGQPATAEAPRFNDDESPLAWLARRRDRSGRPLIDGRELEAGERFRADFHFAHMAPRVTANWSLDAATLRCGAGGGSLDLRDSVVAAQERVRGALAAVGPELAGVLVDVCGHLKGLELAERGNGWPARSGKVVLQLALQALARHYGIAGEPRSAGACRQWGADGYRPRIDG